MAIGSFSLVHADIFGGGGGGGLVGGGGGGPIGGGDPVDEFGYERTICQPIEGFQQELRCIYPGNDCHYEPNSNCL